MPRKGRKRPDAVCPFYKRDTDHTITCEGVAELSTVQLRFGREKDCEIQLGTFCCRRYKYCEIYEAIVKAKYSG